MALRRLLQRTSPWLSVVVAGALLCAIHTVIAHENLPWLWRQWVPNVDRHLTYGELLHYTLLLMAGLPAALLLASALPDGAWAKVRSAGRRGGYWVPALIAAIGAFCVSHFVTQYAWFTDDEQAYLFQMDCYRQLRLSVPALLPEAPFHHPFVVISRVVDGVQYWAGTYSILQPVFMALSSFLGHPLISQWCAVGLISHQTGLLTERLVGERGAGIAASWICASSPMLIGLGATYHTSILACLLSVLSVRALLWNLDSPGFRRGALAGLCAGATFLTRGAEGTLIVLAVGGCLAWSTLRVSLTHLRTLLGFASAGLCALTVFMLTNFLITGDALTSAYTIWGRTMGSFLGYGQDMIWGRAHSPRHGLGQTFVAIVRMNTWLFGWPISLFVSTASLWVNKRPRWVALLASLSVAHLAFYSLLAWGSVHDFGSAYHVWHLPWMTALAVFALRAAGTHVRWVPRAALAMACVSCVAFWPTQIRKWHDVASGILAPVLAAERATKGEDAIVLWSRIRRPEIPSWVFHPPTPFPDSHLWWAREEPRLAETLRHAYPDRSIYRLSWSEQEPVVQKLP